MTLKNLSSDLAFYTTLSVLTRIATIVLVPLYTRVLSQEDFGGLDMIITMAVVLRTLGDFQFAHGFSRFYPSYTKKGMEKVFVGTNMISRMALNIPIASIFIIAGLLGFLEIDIIPSFLGQKFAWIVAVVGVPMELAMELLMLQARMSHRKKLFAFGALFNSLSMALLCILFVIPLKLGIMGVLLGMTLSRTLTTVSLWIGLRNNFSLKFDRGIITEVFKYSLPIVPGWWFTILSLEIGRFFIYDSLGGVQLAILAIVLKITQIVMLFNMAFNMAWQPLAMAFIGKDKSEEFYIHSARYYMIISLVVLFGIVATAGLFVRFFAPASYASAVDYLPLFAIGMAIFGLSTSIQVGNQISKKTSWLSISSFCGLVANALITFLLLKRWGIYAAGWGLCASETVRIAMLYFSSQKNHYIKYDKSAFFLFAVGCVAAGLISRTRNWMAPWQYWLILGAACALIIYFMLRKNEKKAIRQYLAAKLESWT
jgi:O-antigen/teichoic acid export membrane protein